MKMISLRLILKIIILQALKGWIAVLNRLVENRLR